MGDKALGEGISRAGGAKCPSELWSPNGPKGFQEWLLCPTGATCALG